MLEKVSDIELCNIVYNGNLTTDLLKTHMSDISKQDSSGRTAYHWAIVAKKEKMISLLKCLKNSTDPTTTDSSGWSPFHSAVSVGFETEVVTILKNHPEMINKTTNNGQTALFFAISKEREEMIKILMKSGASLMVQDKYGFNPLHRLSSIGNQKIYDFMFESYGQEVILKALMATDSEGNTCLITAAADRNEALLKRYLKITEKEDQDVVNKEGKGVVHYLNDKPVINKLLESMS